MPRRSFLEDSNPSTDKPFQPMIYSINARVFLKELSHLFSTSKTSFHRCPHAEDNGGCLTFEDIPDRYLDWIAQMGFQYVYLLGVWRTSQGGNVEAQKFMETHYPTVPKEEICSSPFAISSYEIHPDFGGLDAFQRFRRRLTRRNLRLILDFVPNHVTLDHQWVTAPTEETKDFILCGNEELMKAQPCNYYKVGDRIIAHGKDPYFDGWVDTAQLNYFSSDLRKTMIRILEQISELCDGVRVDMAMLVNSEIFKKTWGTVYKAMYGEEAPVDYPEFWPQLINLVLMRHPEFIFIGEIYWDLEQTMMDYGFHYCYDKPLYDQLKAHNVRKGADIKRWISTHSLSYHLRSCRFLENHDEERAINAWPDLDVYRAAATIAFTLPGSKLVHFGQLEGRSVRIPMQRCRLGVENQTDTAIDHRASVFDTYYRLLDCLNRFPVIRMGTFEYIEAKPSSSEKTENGHQSLISYIYYESHSRTGVVRNSSQTVNFLSRTSSGRQLIKPSVVCGVSGYISDESSSVPRSSTISEPDIDESEFGTSIEGQNEPGFRQQKQSQLKQNTYHGSSNSISKASKISAVDFTSQSIAAALHRSVSDDSRKPIVELVCKPELGKNSFRHKSSKQQDTKQEKKQNSEKHVYAKHADASSQTNIKENNVQQKESQTKLITKTDKDSEYISDTEEECGPEEEDFKSPNSTPLTQRFHPASVAPIEIQHHSAFTPIPTLVSAESSPNINFFVSTCDRWNPILIVVNYSSSRAHGYVQLPKSLLRAFYARTARFSIASSFPHGAEANLQLGLTQSKVYLLLRDVFVTGESYRRNLLEAMTRGIWFDLKPWGTHIFETFLLDEV